MEEILLEARGLCKSYKERKVVDSVNLTVKSGEIVGLLGPNGAGKTTSFYMVAGLVRPDEGTVNFCGRDVSGLPMHLRARLGMGYLPQEESIFRKLTVEENLMSILETRKDLNRKEQKAKADELLERFNITKLRKSQAIQLSGGEKRRLTIARALASNPKLLMLDEPFAGVDPINVHDLQRQIQLGALREGVSHHGHGRSTRAVIHQLVVVEVDQRAVIQRIDEMARRPRDGQTRIGVALERHDHGQAAILRPHIRGGEMHLVHLVSLVHGLRLLLTVGVNPSARVGD